jgi:hypothetical protein
VVLDAATRRAAAYLIAARDPDGWWRDFDIAGPSDCWVTAYIGEALSHAPGKEAREAATAAWRRLRARSGPGWAYRDGIPCDADSTIWALRLAERLRVRLSPTVWRGQRFLASHIDATGGLATYRSDGPIGQFTQLDDRFRGWRAAHACVTAAGAGLERFAPRALLLDFLRQAQDVDGGWTAYWWADREYATALAAEALSTTGRDDDEQRVLRAVRWARSRLDPSGSIPSRWNPAGSPFATAWGLRLLALGAGDPDVDEALRRSTSWLVGHQHKSGSWPASARLRVPPPDMTDPAEVEAWGSDGQGEASIGTVVLDRRGLHTTATVLRALIGGGQLAAGSGVPPFGAVQAA